MVYWYVYLYVKFTSVYYASSSYSPPLSNLFPRTESTLVPYRKYLPSLPTYPRFIYFSFLFSEGSPPFWNLLPTFSSLPFLISKEVLDNSQTLTRSRLFYSTPHSPTTPPEVPVGTSQNIRPLPILRYKLSLCLQGCPLLQVLNPPIRQRSWVFRDVETFVPTPLRLRCHPSH